MSCAARQYSDQMVCSKCGLAWDINDPEPPQCKPELESRLFRDEPAVSPVTRGQLVSVTFETDPKTGGRVAVLRFTDNG